MTRRPRSFTTRAVVALLGALAVLTLAAATGHLPVGQGEANRAGEKLAENDTDVPATGTGRDDVDDPVRPTGGVTGPITGAGAGTGHGEDGPASPGSGEASGDGPSATDDGSQPPPPELLAAFDAAVPPLWRDAVPVELRVVDGPGTFAYRSGRIEVGSELVAGPWQLLVDRVAHEFGHLIAFEFGSQSHLGAAPQGWPAFGGRPEESWGDCVSAVFTGSGPLPGLPACEGAALDWTRTWLADGPASHPRTR